MNVEFYVHEQGCPPCLLETDPTRALEGVSTALIDAEAYEGPTLDVLADLDAHKHEAVRNFAAWVRRALDSHTWAQVQDALLEGDDHG